MPAPAATNPAPRMKQYRERLRAAGLRPIQLWVPDTRAPGFAAECRRQSAVLAQDTAEADAAAFIEAAGAWSE
ncbi:MAG: antitoxin MazE family protein [Sterolibacteriaceae bacterium MAG5]|nr:antitoxin MazE family protein [Candidatus Nitricoxidireducens bremensis]